MRFPGQNATIRLHNISRVWTSFLLPGLQPAATVGEPVYDG
jgi:hypothetical protein